MAAIEELAIQVMAETMKSVGQIDAVRSKAKAQQTWLVLSEDQQKVYKDLSKTALDTFQAADGQADLSKWISSQASSQTHAPTEIADSTQGAGSAPGTPLVDQDILAPGGEDQGGFCAEFYPDSSQQSIRESGRDEEDMEDALDPQVVDFLREYELKWSDGSGGRDEEAAKEPEKDGERNRPVSTSEETTDAKWVAMLSGSGTQAAGVSAPSLLSPSSLCAGQPLPGPSVSNRPAMVVGRKKRGAPLQSWEQLADVVPTSELKTLRVVKERARDAREIIEKCAMKFPEAPQQPLVTEPGQVKPMKDGFVITAANGVGKVMVYHSGSVSVGGPTHTHNDMINTISAWTVEQGKKKGKRL